MIIPPNKYINWYVSICKNASSRAATKKEAELIYPVIESHHVIPKSFQLGGEKDKNNLVHLTPREHYVCHKLLIFALRGHKFFYYKAVSAITGFRLNNKYQHRILSSHDYEFVRSRCLEFARSEHNPNRGLKRSAETCARISAAAIGRQFSEEWKQNIRKNHTDCTGDKNAFYGKQHSDASKQQIGAKSKARYNPEKIQNLITSTAGTIWICHKGLLDQIRIAELEYPLYLELGYIKGRLSRKECKDPIFIARKKEKQKILWAKNKKLQKEKSISIVPDWTL